jgi:hypothetical protein
VEVTQELKEHRHKVEIAVRRWQRRELAGVFECLSMLVERRCLCRRIMRKMLRRYTRVAQACAFVSWR